MQTELGYNLEGRVHDGQGDLRIEHHPVALDLCRVDVGEARILADRGKIRLEHVRLVSQQIKLRLEEVGTGNRVGRIDLQRLIAQNLQVGL